MCAKSLSKISARNSVKKISRQDVKIDKGNRKRSFDKN